MWVVNDEEKKIFGSSMVEKQAYLKQYIENPTLENRNKVLEAYYYLIRVVSLRMLPTLGESMSLDDIISMGVFGLIDAIEKYDVEKQVKFESYASIRIRGTIIDEIRKTSFIPRTQMHSVKEYDTAVFELETLLGRDVTDAEVAEYMGTDIETVKKIVFIKNIMKIESFDEHLENGSDYVSQILAPEDSAMKKHSENVIAEAINILNEIEKRVVKERFFNDLPFKEIGLLMNMTEAKVCTISHNALKKMNKYLTLKGVDYLDASFKVPFYSF